MIRILCSIVILVVLELHAQELSAPLKKASIPHNFAGQSVPKLDRGYIVGLDYDTATVYALNDYGQTAMQARVWPTDAVKVILGDISAAPNGTFAVAASAFNDAGAPSAFLAWLDATGRIERLVQLPQAAAIRISFAPDGTLWALVRERDGNFDEVPDYDMLRQYDSNGRLMQTALSRKMFSNKTYPGKLAHMSVSNDRIGLYLEGPSAWVELSITGELLGSWQLPPPPPGTQFRVNKVVQMSDGQIYMSITTAGRHVPEESGIYRFDKTIQTLRRVGTTSVPGGKPIFLLGQDGDRLVTTNSYALPSLSWVTVR